MDNPHPSSFFSRNSHTHDTELQDYQLPEMLRVGLEDLALQILILDLGEPSEFLAMAMNPPSAVAMRNSLKLLEQLGALECTWGKNKAPIPSRGSNAVETESCAILSVKSELTALGFHLAMLPVEPRVGKMMIYGALFGCIEPALTIAASMSSKNPFVSPFENRDAADEARQQFSTEDSDHLTVLTAFNEWKDVRRTNGERAAKDFLRDNFLSRMTLFQMDDLRKQYSQLLVGIGFLPRGFQLAGKGGQQQGKNPQQLALGGANANASNLALVKAVLCAGLYPNILVAPSALVDGSSKQEAGACAFESHNKGDVFLHPSTISFKSKLLESRYCCFHEIVKTKKTYVRDCTTVSPFALVLFGGALEVYQREGIVTVDEWLKFRISPKPATLVKHLRAQMESMLLRKIIAPEDDVTESPEAKAVIASISALLARGGHATKAPVQPKPQRNDGGGGGGRGGRSNGGQSGGGRGRGSSGGGRGRGGRGRGRS
jgi:HrpA-like RNA helicase